METLFPLFDASVAARQRDRAMAQVAQHAEDHAPDFAALAAAEVLVQLRRGPLTSEELTLACKAAGIVPHDDRAFGPVYMRLSKAGQITRVGTASRLRGHGTSGGSIWALTEAQQ